ncbi:hypothetical protein KQX54_008579 [Cotesia glomerata]|uniref:Uncharacterized protein n=1 Tax=Cotesia glomerata TaxID=32391 RepID=A0AAV7HWA1_COTGL|nr:hypothetical protein KQX54_008579 [Cotesia glomerata]
MTTISLVDIDDRELGEEKIETFLPEIALLQLNEYEHTNLSETQEINDLDAEATEENSAITSIPIVTFGEEEETSVITPVPVITLEDESKDIFDLSLEDCETKEKGTTSLSWEMNRVIEEIVKVRGKKKKEDRK